MVLSILLAYKNLILQASLSLSLSLFFSFLKVPIFFLYGLFTYIHPENVNNGVRAAIRRPESSNSGSGFDGYQNLSSKTGSEVRKRNKAKEKFEFDEGNAQIFRLKLDESHLQTRLYFNEYCHVFTFSVVGISCLLLQLFLGVSENSGVWENGVFIPVLFGVLGVYKVFVSLAKVSFEKSASRRSDKQLSFLSGFLGFALGLVVCFTPKPLLLDFDFSGIDGCGRLLVAAMMGCFAGFLFIPAAKSARSFWLGTDQLRSNLEMLYCGLFGRMTLYASFLVSNLTALLWINPLSEIMIKKNIAGSNGNADSLIGNVGFTRSDFANFRLLCLLFSGVLQVLALRSNLQMYLNEALLSWYQRLHASKVPDLDFSRAKVFLHNHYLCLTVLQFLATPLLILLFVGLSQINGNLFGRFQLLVSQLPCSVLSQEVPLFMAWWVVFVWAVYTSAAIVLYRRGIFCVS